MDGSLECGPQGMPDHSRKPIAENKAATRKCPDQEGRARTELPGTYDQIRSYSHWPCLSSCSRNTSGLDKAAHC